ncbi:hypothetical protein [Nesterenkonia sp. HG001]|uniref:hypothetical protein n=1 Tax=Nesterenkonia sp. HG001 TaxID=2983207 RepID=UPI002AC6E393|nr:hypothetical protein [Nesterenkonia sp. HG001]MDZ5077825.1 hypothetical protein [Nesterenkonia sp. HG001]
MMTRTFYATAAAAALTIGTAGAASAAGGGHHPAEPEAPAPSAEPVLTETEEQPNAPVLEINRLNHLAIVTWEPVEGAETYRWSLASEEETVDGGLTHESNRAIAYDTIGLEPGFYTLTVTGFDENGVPGEASSVEVQVAGMIGG